MVPASVQVTTAFSLRFLKTNFVRSNNALGLAEFFQNGLKKSSRQEPGSATTTQENEENLLAYSYK